MIENRLIVITVHKLFEGFVGNSNKRGKSVIVHNFLLWGPEQLLTPGSDSPWFAAFESVSNDF